MAQGKGKAAVRTVLTVLTVPFALGAVTVRMRDDGKVERVVFVLGVRPARTGPFRPVVHPVARSLRDYLAGRSRGFSPPAVEPGRSSSFDRAVWKKTRAIPCGETRTYGEIARAIGRPGAARAVGGALSRNPIPLIVPCHRVVGAGGRPGGFSSGAALKRWLLSLEGAL
jgi:methylated-DNA-[protein]-cysteine S-methyltransferase